MTESSDYESVQVFIGVDVGKDTHHAVAINRSGKRLAPVTLFVPLIMGC
ncbi:Transposase [Shigella dysenteriae 1617]|uniref:Transposase n=1 Tax=Shigella dysenteriae 1617 TaxID=754093 RepID=A0A0A6ZQN2_SHIDY|nr:Transposase [Shigella dysenteriae 1617]